MRTFFSALALLALLPAGAQISEGTIAFTKTVKMNIELPPEFAAHAAHLPKEQKTNYELLFAGNKSLLRPAEEAPDGMTMDNGEGIVIKMVGAGGNDVTYTDLEAKKRIDQRELGTKMFVVEDTLARLSWKLGGETKTILGHPCKKASATRIMQSIQVNSDGGKTTRKAVSDTVDVIAWYATDFTCTSGPEYAGNLPGMILELEMDGGDVRYAATKIDAKYEKKALGPPKDGKKVTQEEFKKEQEEFFKKMDEINGGGGRRMIKKE